MSGALGSDVGGVDSSIALQAGRGVTQPVNPLSSYGDYARLQLLQNENRMFPGAMQLQQQQIQQGNVATSNRLNQAVMASILPYTSDPDFNHDMLTTALAAAQARGLDTGPAVAMFSKAIPGGDGPDFQRTIKSVVANGALTDAPVAQVAGTLGSPDVQDTGQVNQPGVRQGVASMGSPGAFAPSGPGIQQVTAPDQNANLVTVTNSDGSKTLVPRSSLPGASGVAGGGPAQAGLPSGPNMGMGSGRPAPAGGASPATSAGNATVGLPIGTPEQIAADVAKFKQDQFALPQGQQNVQSLQKAQEAIQLTQTGRSQATMHNMYSFLVAQGVAPQSLTDNVANYDIARKYMLDYARKQGAAAHSDLQLQAAEGSNANVDVSNQAALNVIKTNIGRERQQIAQVTDAPQNGIGYGGHAANFASQTDPRGFAVDSYTPQELAEIEAGLKTKEQQNKFYKAVGIAQRLNMANPQPGSALMPPPAAGAPAAPSATPSNPPALGPNGA